MAGFEVSRLGSVSEFTREWRVSKYLPLYLAGIAVGAAIGVGLTMQFGGDAAASPAPALVAPVAPAAVAEPHWAEMPAINTHLEAGAIETDLPATTLLALHGYAPVVPPAAPTGSAPAASPVVAPIVPAPPAVAPVSPVAPAAPAAPVAATPALQPEVGPAPAAASVPALKSDFYVPAVAGGGASNLEQRLFAGMNAERVAAGVPALIYDAGLTKVARTRAQQMADQNYFGHVDPAGYSMYTALLKYFGYTSYAWAGENLAMNNAPAAEASERSLVSLMNSPTHRANILTGDFSRVGVGEVTTADGRHLFAMIFLG